MKLHLITIVLDGMPFITWHYPILRQLQNIDWHWHVVEGVALPKGCTSWCAELPQRVSQDGTNEYLRRTALFDKRVTHHWDYRWEGKVEMVNAPFKVITDDAYILMEVDSDEIWTAKQIETIHAMLACGRPNCMRFRCRYFVGPDLVITSRFGFGNHEDYEWRRAWKGVRGDRFLTHEPPVLDRFDEDTWTHAQTESLGLVFDHFAYATKEQIEFKKAYYGSKANQIGRLYANAVEGWKELQRAPMPVAQLNRYLPWVGPDVTADRIKL